MNIYVVRVTTDDREHRVWAAATSCEEAVDRVLEQVPEGWTARLVDGRGDAGQDALHDMKPVHDMQPGIIREILLAASTSRVASRGSPRRKPNKTLTAGSIRPALKETLAVRE